jgi:hypothetical protein
MVYFQTKKSQLRLILEGHGIDNVGMFYDYMKYLTAIWYNLWPYGIVVYIWYIFPNLVCLDQEKSGNPGLVRLEINLFLLQRKIP